MKYNLYTLLVVSSLALLSCSHELNTLEVDNTEHAVKFDSCLNEFKLNFSSETEKLKNMKTRSMKIDNNEEYDLFVDSIGNEIIADLLPSSIQLMREIGLEEADFIEIERELGIPSDFLNVYFALGIMEEMNKPKTRANAEDVASCVVLGLGYKQLVEGGARLALRKCAGKAARRMIPYIGWGWWAAETAACLSRL